MTTFKIIGVYRVKPTIESIFQAAKYHKYDWLADADAKYTDMLIWESTQNLTLIELQVLGEFSPELLYTIFQGNRTEYDQAPYLEYYLDATGNNLISVEEATQTDNRRICFFLHFTDTDMPLNIGEIIIRLPPISELPERLLAFTHYVPVD